MTGGVASRSASTVQRRRLPAGRRGTFVFLRHARQVGHVYLTADVDATAIEAARLSNSAKLSYSSFVVKAAADALADFPEASAMLTGTLRPRLSRIDAQHAKVLFDKQVEGERCVVAATVLDAGTRSILEIQDDINTFRDAAVGPDGPLRRVHLLSKLPLPVIHLLYRAALRQPGARAQAQGTFSVTSVGHTPVRSILPMISGTVGFGVGRTVPTPVVRSGEIVVAPVLTLSLSFDHRVIDGALAADLLAAVTHRLQTWEMP